MLRLSPLLLLLPLARLEPPIAAMGQPLACAQALEVDGWLLCDDELPGTLRALCSTAEATSLKPGDRVRRRSCAAPIIERMDPADLAALEQLVDVNRASVDELASLPGIGPALANRIIAGRPFRSVDELDRVRGIGPRRLAELRSRARVE